jgi:hypothetical protein
MGKALSADAEGRPVQLITLVNRKCLLEVIDFKMFNKAFLGNLLDNS